MNYNFLHFEQLLFLGRTYPSGYEVFRTKLKSVFLKNKGVQDKKKIDGLIGHGHYVIKELEALYSLKKYRTLKSRYYTVD